MEELRGNMTPTSLRASLLKWLETEKLPTRFGRRRKRIYGGRPSWGGDIINVSDAHEEIPLVKPPLNPLRKSASAHEMRGFDAEEEEDIGKVIEESCPLGIFDDSSRCFESETCSSTASTSYSEAHDNPSSRIRWRGIFRVWRSKSAKRMYPIPRIGILKLAKGKKNKEPQIQKSEPCAEFNAFKPSWRNFTLSELNAATDNFSPDNLIGKGGYAEVFKGGLADGELIAVKRQIRGASSDEQTRDFLSELGIIVHLNHPNTAKLIGFSVEGGMHLVLQLSQHGSLSSFLYEGSNEKLDWSTRYKVALGTAEGLEYLHEGCPRRIIHRDIKASNILLSENFDAQISDFGLAKWLPDKLTHHTISSFEGTFGYLAPEYLMHGIVDEKTDVFAYGVLLLELITGRKAIDSSQRSLVMWAKPLLEKNKIREIIDPYLTDHAYDAAQLNLAAHTAYLCIQFSPILRPRMSQVLNLLKGEDGKTGPGKKQQRTILRRTYSEELLDAEEYNATRYLKDLHQHKKLVLDK